MSDPDTKRGLYRKYFVQRIADEDQGNPMYLVHKFSWGTAVRVPPKHADCDYFVLDMSHDAHALAAISAYADSCALDYPDLARDLRRKYVPSSYRSPSVEEVPRPYPATPDHIQIVGASLEQVDAFNMNPGTKWVIYFVAPGGATAQTFASLTRYPGINPSPPAPAKSEVIRCPECGGAGWLTVGVGSIRCGCVARQERT